jgi:hypothetical protein
MIAAQRKQTKKHIAELLQPTGGANSPKVPKKLRAVAQLVVAAGRFKLDEKMQKVVVTDGGGSRRRRSPKGGEMNDGAQQPEGWEIVVMTLDGACESYQVTPDMPVSELQLSIQKRSGVQVWFQRLYALLKESPRSAKKQKTESKETAEQTEMPALHMLRDRTLRQAGVANGSTIQLSKIHNDLEEEAERQLQAICPIIRLLVHEKESIGLLVVHEDFFCTKRAGDYMPPLALSVPVPSLAECYSQLTTCIPLETPLALFVKVMHSLLQQLGAHRPCGKGPLARMTMGGKGLLKNLDWRLAAVGFQAAIAIAQGSTPRCLPVALYAPGVSAQEAKAGRVKLNGLCVAELEGALESYFTPIQVDGMCKNNVAVHVRQQDESLQRISISPSEMDDLVQQLPFMSGWASVAFPAVMTRVLQTRDRMNEADQQ